VTAEVLAPATVVGIKGKSYFTAKKNISAVVVKQGATTLTLTTDYTIDDATTGIITLTSTGAAADGTALTVDYSYAAIITANALPLVYGATNTQIQGRLRFKSNNSTGPNWDLDVFNGRSCRTATSASSPRSSTASRSKGPRSRMQPAPTADRPPRRTSR
jgi:hypothetical protein